MTFCFCYCINCITTNFRRAIITCRAAPNVVSIGIIKETRISCRSFATTILIQANLSDRFVSHIICSVVDMLFYYIANFMYKFISSYLSEGDRSRAIRVDLSINISLICSKLMTCGLNNFNVAYLLAALCAYGCFETVDCASGFNYLFCSVGMFFNYVFSYFFCCHFNKISIENLAALADIVISHYAFFCAGCSLSFYQCEVKIFAFCILCIALMLCPYFNLVLCLAVFAYCNSFSGYGHCLVGSNRYLFDYIFMTDSGFIFFVFFSANGAFTNASGLAFASSNFAFPFAPCVVDHREFKLFVCVRLVANVLSAAYNAFFVRLNAGFCTCSGNFCNHLEL